MEEKTKLTINQEKEDNEIIELKEDDLSTITAGADIHKSDSISVHHSKEPIIPQKDEPTLLPIQKDDVLSK